MRLWKVLGLAGVAGVAASGAVIARTERRRRAYEPDDIRDRLRQRHAEAVEAAGPDGGGGGGDEGGREPGPQAPASTAPGCLGGPVARARRRWRRRREP